MGLTSFAGGLPALKDISVAKNYLLEDEVKILNNLVSGYFDLAEINAIEHKPMYMNDYVEQLDLVLSSGNRKLLTDAGKVSHDQAVKKAKSEYRKYQEKTISPVEEAYIETIKDANKSAKQGTRRKQMMNQRGIEMRKHPKLFISYLHDNEEHKAIEKFEL